MFMGRETFPFLALLEAHWRSVLAELQALPQSAFLAWPGKGGHTGRWDGVPFVVWGEPYRENQERCPETAQLLAQVPGLTSAGFSRLAPGTHIIPHRGLTRSVLRAHLALITPQDCALRVGSAVWHWTAGEAFAFDDTQVHEAWNRSTSERIVLMADFYRPWRLAGNKLSYLAERAFILYKRRRSTAVRALRAEQRRRRLEARAATVPAPG